MYLWSSGDAQRDLCQDSRLEYPLWTKKWNSPASKREALGQGRAWKSVAVSPSEFVKIGKRREADADVVLAACHPAILGQIADDADASSPPVILARRFPRRTVRGQAAALTFKLPT